MEMLWLQEWLLVWAQDMDDDDDYYYYYCGASFRADTFIIMPRHAPVCKEKPGGMYSGCKCLVSGMALQPPPTYDRYAIVN